MIALKVLFCIIFGMLTISSETNAACNICAKKLWACVNSTSFNPCPDGQNPLKSQILHCPTNTVCTEDAGICKPNGSDVVPGCVKDGCNKCSATTPVTCLTRTSYGFCGSNNTVIGVVKCEDGNVCDFSKLSTTGICATACAGTPSCDNDEIEVTTAAPVGGDPKGYCYNTDGYHVVKSNCSQYVYCEKVGDNMEVVLFNCSTGFFDEKSEECISNKPADCT